MIGFVLQVVGFLVSVVIYYETLNAALAGRVGLAVAAIGYAGIVAAFAIAGVLEKSLGMFGFLLMAGGLSIGLGLIAIGVMPAVGAGAFFAAFILGAVAMVVDDRRK